MRFFRKFIVVEEAERKVETILAVRETSVVEASLADEEAEVVKASLAAGETEVAGVEVEMETGAEVEIGEKSSSKSLTSCLNFFLKV